MGPFEESAEMKKKLPILIKGDGTLQNRLYHSIRTEILEGRLPPGSRLPSSRSLSQESQVSRNTVLAVLDQLAVEGYTVGKVGSGTYVSDTLPDNLMSVPARSSSQTTLKPSVLSQGKRATTLTSFWRKIKPSGDSPRPFALGMSALDEFPVSVWGRLLGRCWRDSHDEIVNRTWPTGHPSLRKAIAAYTQASRGLQCTEDQVLIVNGTQQAISLAAQVLLDPGDPVWMEDPGYDCARVIFTAAGAKIHPMDVDSEGLDVQAGVSSCPYARLAFVTPSHQFPLGITMTLPRRLALLDWARKNDAWIFEDDYDHEFRYSGRPIQALQGLDRHHRVIYTGTFSKMMFPGLRLGYMVLPPSLVESFLSAKYFSDAQSSALEQMTMAAFIEGGYYAGHVRRVRRLCSERQSVFVESMTKYLSGKLEVRRLEAGLHLIGWLQKGANDRELAQLCDEAGISVHPLSRYSIRPLARTGLVMGYAAYNAAAIRAGARKLAKIF